MKKESYRKVAEISLEERQRRRESILKTKPWLHLKGTKTEAGKRKSAMNAVKNGLYSTDPKTREIARRLHKEKEQATNKQDVFLALLKSGIFSETFEDEADETDE